MGSVLQCAAEAGSSHHVQSYAEPARMGLACSLALRASAPCDERPAGGAQAVANILRFKLVEEVEGYHHLTWRGLKLIETPPYPLPDGSRIVKLQWVTPPENAT